MSVVTVPTDAERRRTAVLTYVAAALIALALAAPIFAPAFGFGDNYNTGAAIARTLFALAFFGLISWLATRKRSDLAKAKGRLTVGVLACLSVVGNFVAEKDQLSIAQNYVRDTVALYDKYTKKFSELDGRFEQVDIAQYLTPDALVSTSGVAAGEATLERYRALLAERNLLLRTYVNEYTALINSLPPGGAARRGAEAAAGPSRQATEDLYRMLDSTQSANASAIQALFEWAKANRGSLSVQGGRLMVRSDQQQREFAALVVKLQETEAAVNAGIEKAQVEVDRAKATRDRVLKEADSFLSK